MSRTLLPLLAAFVVLAGCRSEAAPEAPAPAAEVIVLTHYTYGEVPLAAAVAALEGTTVTSGTGGVRRVALGGEPALVLAVYPGHDAIVARLQDRAHPPAGAVFMISAAEGAYGEQHGAQARLAHEAGVPVAAALMAEVHLVDDRELLDLQEQLDIGETLAEAGYVGVPVVRASTREALDGDAEDQAALRALLGAIRQTAASRLAAR